MQKEFYLVAEGSGGGADGYEGSESGVEPDYPESYFDSEEAHDILFDMSDEQVMAALRYFTSTSQRTNMLTKTHSNDLEMIAQLLSDKEKDLEMTAKIGQSLLQRNKQLMVKIETMEDYLSQTTENANQLQHDLQMKNKLVEFYNNTQDDDVRSTTSSGSKGDRSIDDEEIVKLTNRCKKLEKDNQTLFSEALGLKQMTDEMEEKEEALVLDCIEQLASAKLQITQLTDEIALKFEDNLQQQMEISQLINMVVELQRKQKMLMDENGELQEQLAASNENRENLQEQLHEMQVKFRETKELMIEHQEELKILKSRLDTGGDNPCDWMSDSGHSLNLQDSLATEIEETVRRDLTSTLAKETNKVQNKRVLENVRHLNVRGSDTTSGRTSPASVWSLASDERSESLFDLESRVKKPTRKLQIVKPMEGSDTLNKWHHLASKNVRGGLDVSAEEKPTSDPEEEPEEEEANVSRETDDGQLDTTTVAAGDPDETTDASSIHEPQVVSPRPRPVVKPRPKPRPRVLSDLSAPQKKTIITRNSAALRSVRKGRSLLNSEQKEGRSQADVIDMIASAMGKVKMEAGTEQRILSSLNQQQPTTSTERVEQREKSSSIRSDYTDMPNVSKILNKAAQMNEIEKDSEPSVADMSPEQTNLENVEVDSAVGHSIDNKSTSSTVTRMSTPRRVESDLRSITGPLGLLNRSDGSESRYKVDMMNNLLRYSTGDDASILDTSTPTDSKRDSGISSGVDSQRPHSTTDLNSSRDDLNNDSSNKDEDILTTLNNSGDSDGGASVASNVTTASLLDMVTTSRLKVRPMGGIGNLVGIDTRSLELPLEDTGRSSGMGDEELDIDVDDKTRTDEASGSSNVQQSAGGSGSMKQEAGLFGFFSSFLS